MTTQPDAYDAGPNYMPGAQDRPMLPGWEALTALDSRWSGHVYELRIDTGDFRVWTSRCGLADGEPFEHTVYVEVRAEPFDRGSDWIDLGHYDGDDPPYGLPGLTPHALRGEIE